MSIMTKKQLVDRLIRQSWGSVPAGAWSPLPCAVACMTAGMVPAPDGMTPGQKKLFETTVRHLYIAVGQVRDKLAAWDVLDPEITRQLLRAGVAFRMLKTPGETPLIRRINAIRGERQPFRGALVQKLHGQMSFPAGVIDAVNAALNAMEDADTFAFQHLQMHMYREALVWAMETAKRSPKD